MKCYKIEKDSELGCYRGPHYTECVCIEDLCNKNLDTAAAATLIPITIERGMFLIKAKFV